MRKVMLLLCINIILFVLSGCSGSTHVSEDMNQFRASTTKSMEQKYYIGTPEDIKWGLINITKQERELSHEQISTIAKLLNGAPKYNDTDVNSISTTGYDVVLALKDRDIALFNLLGGSYVLLRDLEANYKGLILSPELNEYIELQSNRNIKIQDINSIEIVGIDNEKVTISNAEIIDLIQNQLNKSAYIGSTGCPFDNTVIFNMDAGKVKGEIASDGDKVLRIDDQYIALTDKAYKILEKKVRLTPNPSQALGSGRLPSSYKSIHGSAPA